MPTKTKRKEATDLPSYELLSWKSAAAYAGPDVTVRSIKKLAYSKKIKSVLWGGRRLVPRSEIDRYLSERMTHPDGQ